MRSYQQFRSASASSSSQLIVSGQLCCQCDGISFDMGKGATMSVKVSTYETEFDLQLKPNSNGKELIDTIVNLTGIREVRESAIGEWRM